MALFAIWHDGAGGGEPPAGLHRLLLNEAPIAPERTISATLDTAGGPWHLAAFACASRFYAAEAQIWQDGAGGACIIHGLIWRASGGQGRLLDAAAMAALLDRPGRELPANLAGEYAVARLHPCGTLEAFADPDGLQQLFHRDDGRAAVANRAGFLAALAGDWTADRESALWLAAMGYRAGTRSAWRGVSQLVQGAQLIAKADGATIRHGAPLTLPEPRGFAHGGAALLEEGLEQARAAVRLAAGDGPLDLPLTGGKDSRVVLAIALSAGLRDCLTLFTRGHPDHPDVRAAEGIARALGLPHRREAPPGSDLAPDLSAEAFVRLQATIAYQTDGGMGGWDNVSGTAIGRDTLVSGHMGELLKAYAKRPPGDGPLDPIEMVRLQAPFDPMALLRGDARALLADRLADQTTEARAAGAGEGDLPDLFYWRNRIPNWLGGMRAIKSFERQPVLPLGVPALVRLAFRMTPEERQAELAHYRLIERAAPELLPFPFAHQRWHSSLGIAAEPLVAAAGTSLFGTWQWAINRGARTRAYLAAIFEGIEIPLWEDVDRAALLGRLRDRRFDYFDGISLLGITTAALHQSGMVRPIKLGGGEGAARPTIALSPLPVPPRLTGYLDSVEGGAVDHDGALRVAGDGVVRFNGWLQAPGWPGASVAVEARVDGVAVAVGPAANLRPDLAAAGIGEGRHGFLLEVDAARLAGSRTIRLTGVESDQGPVGGDLRIGPAPAARGLSPS